MTHAFGLWHGIQWVIYSALDPTTTPGERDYRRHYSQGRTRLSEAFRLRSNHSYILPIFIPVNFGRGIVRVIKCATDITSTHYRGASMTSTKTSLGCTIGMRPRIPTFPEWESTLTSSKSYEKDRYRGLMTTDPRRRCRTANPSTKASNNNGWRTVVRFRSRMAIASSNRTTSSKTSLNRSQIGHLRRRT